MLRLSDVQRDTCRRGEAIFMHLKLNHGCKLFLKTRTLYKVSLKHVVIRFGEYTLCGQKYVDIIKLNIGVIQLPVKSFLMKGSLHDASCRDLLSFVH